ncbi:MAG TPA: FoF1 ATP synthase subunit gamma [Acidobacteriaceae bacterium]
MANVLDLKRRIRSVKNTRQITKAMKMVAAAKLRRAQERMTNARPYAAMLASVLVSLKRRIEIYDPITGELRHPLLATREEKNILLLVVSGDKGFAGAFSTNIIKAAARFLAEGGGPDQQPRQIDVETIGRKARDYFRRRYPAARFAAPEGNTDPGHTDPEHPQRQQRAAAIETLGEHDGMLDKIAYDQVRVLSDEVVRRYAHAEIDAVYLVYNEFKSVVAQRVVVERILPLVETEAGALANPEAVQADEPTREERDRAAEAAQSAGITLRDAEADAINQQADEEAKTFGTAEVDYLYEQPPAELYNAVLPRYVTALIYHAMLESVAAENAARMTAMDAATSNASDMIDSLTLTMNRARQAAITKEIIEIVSGAAAV